MFDEANQTFLQSRPSQTELHTTWFIQKNVYTKNLQCLDNYFREMSRLVSVNYNNIYEEVDVHVSLSFQYHKIILTDIRYQQLFLFLFRNNCHHNSDVNAQT